MTLEDLQRHYGLADDIVRFCHANDLLDLEAMRVRAATTEGFAQLPGCTTVIEKRLLDLLTVELIKPKEARKALHALSGLLSGRDGVRSDRYHERSLRELQHAYGLSARALNVCVRNGLHTLHALQEYAVAHGGVKGLIGCGKRTALELEDLLAGYRPTLAAPVTAVDPAPSVPPPPEQPVEVDLQELALRFAGLSVRAQNALRVFVGSTEPRSVLEVFILSEVDPTKIRNVGVKTRDELLAFRQGILHMGSQVPAAIERPPDRPHLRLYKTLRTCFSKAEMAVLSKAPFIVNDREVDPWPLMRTVLAIWSSRMEPRYQVLDKWLALPAQQRTSQQVGLITGFSSERVRQILHWWRMRFHTELPFIPDLPFAAGLSPNLALDQGYQLISNEQIQQVRVRGGGELPAWFIAQVLAARDPARAKVLSWEQVLGPTGRSRTLGDELALIVVPDLLPLIKSIVPLVDELCATPRRSSEMVTWEALFPSLGMDDRSWLPALSSVLPVIFDGLKADAVGVCFPLNAKPFLADLLEQVLEKLGEPTSVQRIQEELNLLVPDREWSLSSIRSTAIRERDRFTSFGRTSTYGLRRWDHERADVRSGTIRDIVATALADADRPLHVNEITLFVQRFRPTTRVASIRLNLKLDTSGRFNLIREGYVGLVGKQYAGPLPALKAITGTYFRQVELMKHMGRPVLTAAQDIADRTGVEVKVIEATLRSIIKVGRLRVDGADVIVGIGDGVEGTELPPDGELELPFSWE